MNKGREWQPKKQPIEVSAYDFLSLAEGKAVPYGVYDVTAHVGFVNVGMSHDTGEFSVASIRRWWSELGKARYPEATRLYITSDSGGSNSATGRLYKVELQALANSIGLEIHVSHFPPGASKWNPIEHLLFGPISINWRGQPLSTFGTVVNYIANTTTKTGLTVHAVLDPREYATGRKVEDATLAALNLVRNDFHGNWNYVIKPQPRTAESA